MHRKCICRFGGKWALLWGDLKRDGVRGRPRGTASSATNCRFWNRGLGRKWVRRWNMKEGAKTGLTYNETRAVARREWPGCPPSFLFPPQTHQKIKYATQWMGLGPRGSHVNDMRCVEQQHVHFPTHTNYRLCEACELRKHLRGEHTPTQHTQRTWRVCTYASKRMPVCPPVRPRQQMDRLEPNLETCFPWPCTPQLVSSQNTSSPPGRKYHWLYGSTAQGFDSHPPLPAFCWSNSTAKTHITQAPGCESPFNDLLAAVNTWTGRASTGIESENSAPWKYNNISFL